MIGGARDQRGNIYRRNQARVEDCARYPFRKDCLQRGGKQRSLHVPKATERTATRSRQMRAKIDLPSSRTIYAKRLAIVEPVFANIRVQKGMNRFTYRGQAKVNIQWLLFCLVHNLERIAHFGTQWLEKAVEKAWRAARRDFQSFLEVVCAVCMHLHQLFVTTATPCRSWLSLVNTPRYRS